MRRRGRVARRHARRRRAVGYGALAADRRRGSGTRPGQARRSSIQIAVTSAVFGPVYARGLARVADPRTAVYRRGHGRRAPPPATGRDGAAAEAIGLGRVRRGERARARTSSSRPGRRSRRSTAGRRTGSSADGGRRPRSAPRSSSAGRARCRGRSPTPRAARSPRRGPAAASRPSREACRTGLRRDGRAASATCGSTRRSRPTARSTPTARSAARCAAAGWRPAPPIQPASTRIIDLRADEAALWGDLRKKWRQYVNKARTGGDRGRRRRGRPPRRVLPDLPRDRGPGRLPDPDRGRLPRRLGRLPAGRAARGCCSPRPPTASRVATLFLVRCGPRVVEPYGGMTAAGAESPANYLLKWEAIRSSREAGRHELRPVGPRDRRDRPLQDRVRRPRGPLHRRVGPRPRPARPAGVRGGGQGAASGGRAGGTASPGRPGAAGVRGRPIDDRVREATPAELDDWDADAVEAPGGHVYQSRAWAEHRARLRLAAAVPRAERRRPGLALSGRGRSSAAAAPTSARAGRRSAPTARRSPRAWSPSPTALAGATGSTSSRPTRRSPRRDRAFGDGDRRRRLPRRSRRSSRRATGSRCRSTHGVDETLAFGRIAKSTRQRIRGGRDAPGWRSSRHDARLGPDGAGEGFVAPDERRRTSPSTGSTTCCSRPASGGSSRSGRAAGFVAWWRRALAAGHLVYLEAREGRGRRDAARRPRPVPPRRPPLDRPLRRPRRTRGASTRARSTCSAGGRSSSRSARAARRWTSAAWTSPAPAASRVEGEPMYGPLRAQALVRRPLARARPAPTSGSSGRGATRPGRLAGRVARVGPAMSDDGRTIARAARRRRARRAGAASTASSTGSTAEGRLRGARRDGRAIGPHGLAAVDGPRRDRRLARGPRRARCSSRSRARTSTATTSSAGRRRRARPPRSSSGRSPSSPLPAARRRRGSQPALADARPRGGTATRATSWRSSGSPARTARRRPRSSRSAALEAAGVRTGMIGTAATRIGGRQEPNEAHATTPEAPDLQAAPPGDGRGRRPGRGRRDDLARPRPRARRRDRLRRRDPHQPHPRAPRVPRHVGGVPRRQALAVRAAGARAGAPGRSRRAAPGRGPASSTPTTRSAGRVHRRSRRRPAPGS